MLGVVSQGPIGLIYIGLEVLLDWSFQDYSICLVEYQQEQEHEQGKEKESTSTSSLPWW